MVEVYKNYSLKNLNSFNVDVQADYYVAPKSIGQIQELVKEGKYKNVPRLVLGGGSNLLFTKDFRGMVIHPQIKGISIEKETEDYVSVKVGAGENWDSFVEWAVNQNFGGIENLSLIPGNVGASPVQNIGAYGVEAKDYISKVDAIDFQSGTSLVFTNADCDFAYRNSIFKNKLKDRYLISYVYFRLSKKPTFLLEYGKIKDELKKFNVINLKTIRQSIINIREAKLPDPTKTPNAGSFFKNPVVSQKKFTDLLKKFPKIVNYPLNEKQVKLAAGWLIDNAGLKGFVLGKVGVHENQALVLVNHSNASGKEILALAEYVKQTVFAKFSVTLDFEVIIY